MPRLQSVVIFLSLCATAIAQDNPFDASREWTDATGNFTVRAELVEVTRDVAKLRKLDTGEVLTVKIAQLSDADQKYCNDAASALAARRSAEKTHGMVLKKQTAWIEGLTKDSDILATNLAQISTSGDTSAKQVERTLEELSQFESKVEGQARIFCKIADVEVDSSTELRLRVDLLTSPVYSDNMLLQVPASREYLGLERGDVLILTGKISQHARPSNPFAVLQLPILIKPELESLVDAAETLIRRKSRYWTPTLTAEAIQLHFLITEIDKIPPKHADALEPQLSKLRVDRKLDDSALGARPALKL